MDAGELLADFEAACRKAGLRFTRQRLEVYRELLAAGDHPSAETIHRRLRVLLPDISLDTVYRTLATLVKYDLARKVGTAESQARFEVMQKRHHHFICSRCNSIMDFEWRQVEEVPLPEEIGRWGRIDSTNVVLDGVCAACLQRRDTAAADGAEAD